MFFKGVSIMVCKICNQDIESFKTIDRFYEDNLPYRKCCCIYCGSEYKLLDLNESNDIVVLDTESRTYDSDLSMVKRVRLAKKNKCSISDITESQLRGYTPRVVSHDKFLIPLKLTSNYKEDSSLMRNASAENKVKRGEYYDIRRNVL